MIKTVEGKQKYAAFRKRKDAQGLCIRGNCKKPRVTCGFCAECLVERRLAVRAHRQKKAELGICRGCDQASLPDSYFCEACRNKDLAKSKRWYAAKKAQAEPAHA